MVRGATFLWTVRISVLLVVAFVAISFLRVDVPDTLAVVEQSSKAPDDGGVDGERQRKVATHIA